MAITDKEFFSDFGITKTARSWKNDFDKETFESLKSKRVLTAIKSRKFEGQVVKETVGGVIETFELAFINGRPHLFSEDGSEPPVPINGEEDFALFQLNLQTYVDLLMAENFFSVIDIRFKLPSGVFYIGSRQIGQIWVHWLGMVDACERRIEELANFFESKSNASSKFIFTTPSPGFSYEQMGLDQSILSLGSLPGPAGGFKISSALFLNRKFGIKINDVIESSRADSLIIGYEEGAIVFCGQKLINRETQTFTFLKLLAENVDYEFGVDDFAKNKMGIDCADSSRFLSKHKSILRSKAIEIFGKDSYQVDLLEKLIPNRERGKYGTIKIVSDVVDIHLFK